MSSLETENSNLINMIETLDIPSRDKERYFGTIVDEAKRLIVGIEDDLEKEMKIERLFMGFRSNWISYVHSTTDQYLKSPPFHQKKSLPNGKRISFSYERNIQPIPLERKATTYRAHHSEWVSDHVLFSSGMAALSTFIQTYISMLKPTATKPLNVQFWGAYFETRGLLELYRSESFRYKEIESCHELNQNIFTGDGDLFIIEPVRYDWELDVFDFIETTQQLLTSKTQKLRTIIIDTTLVGNTFPLEFFLHSLSQLPHTIIVHFHSGLKLDQQGLEFSNVGLLSVYTPVDDQLCPSAKRICEYLRKVRTIVGSGLSLHEIGLLGIPFFLNKEDMGVYSEAVFANNAKLAQSIFTNGLFKKVVHPSLKNELPWANSPFVVFHLKEDTLENHGLLLSIISYEAQKRGLCFSLGSSFGFRSHRFEVIIPKVSEQKGLFKVAMGAREGSSRDEVIRLLQEVGSYSTFSELRDKYPNINPIDLSNLE